MPSRIRLGTPSLKTLRIALSVCLLASLALVGAAPVSAQSVPEVMAFAADMAERGSWREARYRWELAEDKRPGEPKVLNNLGVAYEVMGDTTVAREYYRAAAAAAPGDPSVQENLRRFTHFWRQVWNEEDGDAGTEEIVGYGEHLQGKPKKLKGKPIRVQVGLPVPARLEIRGDEKLLVTSFLAGENNLMDTNRELVRFLRAEFRKDTELDVLEVNPPPAIPEQTVEDLLANYEFWRYLGRNYESEIIVSGVIQYDREDLSAFQNVDVYSERTGQKVRRTQFVEQEQFMYFVDLFFIDGKTGTLMFRDRLQRAVIFQGTMNDPINAFYSISDSIAADVLAVVVGRTRADTRLIFKK